MTDSINYLRWHQLVTNDLQNGISYTRSWSEEKHGLIDASPSRGTSWINNNGSQTRGKTSISKIIW